MAEIGKGLYTCIPVEEDPATGTRNRAEEVLAVEAENLDDALQKFGDWGKTHRPTYRFETVDYHFSPNGVIAIDISNFGFDDEDEEDDN